MKSLKLLFFIGAASILIACGGGNKGASATKANESTTTTSSSTAASIDVLTSSNVLPSSGAEVLITAYVKNASNATIPAANVVFSATSGNLQSVSTVSDASGVVTAKLSAGSNKSIRNITVTVTAGSVSGNVVIAVTDTAVTVAGNGSLSQNAASSVYTVRAVDSANAPISGAAFSVTSSLSNAIVTSPLTTNASGSATFTYTPTNAGTDILTVSGLGLITKTTVGVSNVDFSVFSPASNTTISVGANQDITVQYKIATVGQANKAVTFSTTRGTITCDATSCVTGPDGKTIAKLTSTTAGPATVLAQIAGVGQVSLPVQFMAGAPSTVVVQANPSAVSPNSAGSTINQSTIEALVRDVNLNAVANTPVAFSLVSDLSNGSLSSGVATTDVNGRAQVQFIPGANSTANNGVVIKAEAGATPVVSGQTALTVSGQALFINIAFGNDMASLNSTTYSKPYSVYVTTATGGAVPNQTLSLSVIPIDYDKGSMAYDAPSSLWLAVPTKAGCANEDVNKNGILDPGEDINGSLTLTPGNIAIISPVTVTTDTLGMASFSLNFGKQFARWTQVEIIARTTVAGTESSRSIQVRLPILNADIGDASVPPAGRNSPFGLAAVCTDKN